MKVYSKEHKQALKLKSDMDNIEKRHLDHINKFDELITHATSDKDKNRIINAWDKIEEKYNKKEDIAYTNYYKFMHKHLDIDKNTDFNKYKEGFGDKKFINEMFKKKVNAKKRSVKKWDRNHNNP